MVQYLYFSYVLRVYPQTLVGQRRTNARGDLLGQRQGV
jgi:hypothetical protein